MTRKRICAVAAVVIVVAVVFVTFFSLNGNSADFSHREMRLIVTDSMDGEKQPYEIETIPKDSVVMIHDLDSSELSQIKVGDVISFRYHVGSATILDCHRVVEIHYDSEGNVTGFKTHGDNTSSGSYEEPSADDVTGVVVGVSPLLGKIIRAVQSNLMFVIMFIIILIVMASAVIDIVRVRKADRKQ